MSLQGSHLISRGYGPGQQRVPTRGLGYSFTSLPLQVVGFAGPVTGGTYVIVDNAITSGQYVDNFSGSVLHSDWADISSGGSIVVNNGLYLTTPTTGGTAGILSTFTWNDFDISIPYTFNTAVAAVYPQRQIDFLQFTAAVDANNYILFTQAWSPTSWAIVLKFTVVTGGVTLYTTEITAGATIKFIRVIRFGANVYVYAGSKLIATYLGWLTTPTHLSIVNSNYAGSPLPTTTTVIAFKPSTLVAFGNNLALNVTEADGRIYVNTPAGLEPGVVDISMYSISTSYTLTGAFTYTPVQRLVLLSQQVEIAINDDDTLR